MREMLENLAKQEHYKQSHYGHGGKGGWFENILRPEDDIVFFK